MLRISKITSLDLLNCPGGRLSPTAPSTVAQTGWVSPFGFRQGLNPIRLRSWLISRRLLTQAPQNALCGPRNSGWTAPDEPHWYLPFIGVRPEAQGRGMGAHLLELGLDRADADGMPAYLEATSRRSVPLYSRHGFKVIGVVNAPEYPEIFAM